MTAKLCLTTVSLYAKATHILNTMRKDYEMFYYEKQVYRRVELKKRTESRAKLFKDFIDKALDDCTKSYAVIACYLVDVQHLDVLDMLEEHYVKDKSDTIICLDAFSQSISALAAKQKAVELKEKMSQQMLF